MLSPFGNVITEWQWGYECGLMVGFAVALALVGFIHYLKKHIDDKKVIENNDQD